MKLIRLLVTAAGEERTDMGWGEEGPFYAFHERCMFGRFSPLAYPNY